MGSVFYLTCGYVVVVEFLSLPCHAIFHSLPFVTFRFKINRDMVVAVSNNNMTYEQVCYQT